MKISSKLVVAGFLTVGAVNAQAQSANVKWMGDHNGHRITAATGEKNNNDYTSGEPNERALWGGTGIFYKLHSGMPAAPSVTDMFMAHVRPAVPVVLNANGTMSAPPEGEKLTDEIVAGSYYGIVANSNKSPSAGRGSSSDSASTAKRNFCMASFDACVGTNGGVACSAVGGTIDAQTCEQYCIDNTKNPNCRSGPGTDADVSDCTAKCVTGCGGITPPTSGYPCIAQ